MTKTDYLTDPLQEKKHEVLPGLIHKYDNRVLCHLTYRCPSNCEFCFRENLYEKNKSRATDEEILGYLENQPQVKEFIFSGGEPLVKTKELVSLAQKLSSLENLKIFRIHTRLPITFPQSLDFKSLTKLSQQTNQPWYLVIHVNSDQELKKPNVVTAIEKLRRLGFILLSHTVFLKGVNDNLPTLEKLFNHLIELGVKPYYIFHCDYMSHTEKFIVPLKKEQQLMTELRKKVSGLAYPLHVIDSSSGSGKIPVPTKFWDCSLNAYLGFDNQENAV